MRDNLYALEFEIPEKFMMDLNEATQHEKAFHHSFYDEEMVKAVTYGKTLNLIDNHRNTSK